MRLLFIGPTRIGDAVLSSGVLEWLLARWPGARVTVAAGAAAAPLYGEVPGLEELIPLFKRAGGAHWRGLWLRTAGRLWTAVADTRRTAVAWLIPTRARFVMSAERAGWHKVLQASAMVRAPAPLAPTIWLGPRQRAAARDIMGAERPILALAPTANWGGKQWPGERFVALAQRLTDARGPLCRARIAVFSAAEERDGARPVLDALPPDRRIDLAGRLDLLTAAACLAHADLFVGNDSALMHMAAAMGAPTLGLFGPSRPEHYAPWGPRGRAVATDLSYSDIVGAPGYDYRRQESHMGTLSVEKVHAAAVELLRQCPARPA